MIFDVLPDGPHEPVVLCWGTGWNTCCEECGSAVLIPRKARVQMSDEFLTHMPVWAEC